MPLDYETAIPKTEQEIPPQRAEKTAVTDELSPSAVENIERANLAKKAEQEIHLKDNAFLLLCACLAGCLFLYLFDSGFAYFGKSSSSTLTNILDLAKTVITFLLGYLFAYEKAKN